MIQTYFIADHTGSITQSDKRQVVIGNIDSFNFYNHVGNETVSKNTIGLEISGMYNYPTQDRKNAVQSKRNHVSPLGWVEFIRRIKPQCFPMYCIVGTIKDEPTLYDSHTESDGGSLFQICKEIVKGPGYLKLVSDFSNGVIIDEICRITQRNQMKICAIMHPNDPKFDFDKFFGRVMLARHRGYRVEVVVSGTESHMFIYQYWKSVFARYDISVKMAWGENLLKTSPRASEMVKIFTKLGLIAYV